MIESIKEYYINPYKKELKATIIQISDNKIYLDTTIFYPEGGGQPGDKGFINNYKIVDTQKEGESIAHILNEQPNNLIVGDEVLIKLDWDTRYAYMKMHTAQHLISGILQSFFDVSTVSVHQGSEVLAIEIDNDKFSEDSCYKAVDIANNKIIESLDVSYSEMKRCEAENLNLRRSIKVDGLIRIVNIENTDLIACGGIHVNNTSEIERIMFCGVEKVRKHYRLLFKVSKQAFEAERENTSIIKELNVLHSSTLGTLVSCSKQLIEKNIDLEKQISLLQKDNTNLTLKSLVESSEDKIIAKDMSAFNIEFKSIELSVDKVLFFYSVENSFLKWFIYLGPSFEKYNIKSIREDVLSIINGKGGGRYPIFQGKGESKNIEKCVDAFLGYFNER